MFLRRETQKLEFLSSFFTFENLPQNEQNVNPYYKVQQLQTNGPKTQNISMNELLFGRQGYSSRCELQGMTKP